jgi:hypothetical protein
MGGNGPSRRRRRRIALRLLVAGGALLLIGVIVFIVGSVAVSHGASPGGNEGGSTPTQTGNPTSSAGPTPVVAAGSSPWNATNVFGGITAITGLIGALTGVATLRASRHQAPQTVYVMASQPPVAPAAGPVPGPSELKAENAGPAQAHEAGEDKPAPGTTDRSA